MKRLFSLCLAIFISIAFIACDKASVKNPYTPDVKLKADVRIAIDKNSYVYDYDEWNEFVTVWFEVTLTEHNGVQATIMEVKIQFFLYGNFEWETEFSSYNVPDILPANGTLIFLCSFVASVLELEDITFTVIVTGTDANGNQIYVTGDFSGDF